MDLDTALAPFRARPGASAVFTDYDGTLAPIVDDPEAAVPMAEAPATLTGLARRIGLVVVVSGRPVSFLREHLGQAEGVVFAGLYGLERVRGDETVEVPEAAGWRAVVEEVAAAADAEAPSGVLVERKGLAVGLHVRTAPEHDDWLAGWAAAQAKRSGLVAHNGRRSIELRPPIAIDKGTVVAELAAGFDAVCFMGDDRGDLAGFEALSALAATGVYTLAVAVASDESPPELLAAADLVVDGPPRVLELLARFGT